jgi:hypothetical protein
VGKKKVHLDPYILSAWLGDGNKDGSGFSSTDIEIISVWQDLAIKNNAEIIHRLDLLLALHNSEAVVGSRVTCNLLNGLHLENGIGWIKHWLL